jgi:hypothetical protein
MVGAHATDKRTQENSMSGINIEKVDHIGIRVVRNLDRARFLPGAWIQARHPCHFRPSGDHPQ